MNTIEIKKNSAGQRVDKFILKYLNKASKAFVYKMFRKKRIKLNNSRIQGNEMLKENDVISFYISPETLNSFKEEISISVSNSNLDIIFEDKHILVANKPAGMFSQPIKRNDDNNINDEILFYLSQKNAFDTSKNSTFTPSICNRLDRNTSGIIVAGKTLPALQSLNQAFANKKIDRIYTTIVKGNVKSAGTIKSFHSKDEDTNKVTLNNKKTSDTIEIETLYNPIVSKNGYTLLEVSLITGKAHQIRAHLEEIGHPVIGDNKYGDSEINAYFRKKYGLKNQLLHANKIILKQDDEVLDYLYEKIIVAPLPKIFEKITADLF